MAYYLFSNKLNTVVELNIPLSEYRKFLKNGNFRQATVTERITYVKNKTISDITKYYDYNENMLDVYFSAPIGRNDGHSTVADFMIKYAKRHGVYLNRIYTGQKIGLLYNHPIHIDELKTPHKIVYTGFESDIMPQEWKQYLQKADEVWTFSSFCQRVMRESLQIESQVYLHGVDTEVFTPRHNWTNKFVFLHYDAFKWRKGWDLVLTAFIKKFENNPNVELWLKTSGNKGIPLDYPNIKVIKGGYNDSRLADLMNQANCFVFPSRGEGFGMPPLEALASDVPTIITAWGGMKDYYNKEYIIGLDGQHIKAKYEVARYKDLDLGHMAECSIDDLADAMYFVYDNYHYYDKKKLNVYASKYSADTHIAKMASRLIEISQKEIKAEKPILSIIILTYNALDYTKKCLKSIKSNTTVDYEVIVMDNASSDGTQEYLQKILPKLFTNFKLILNSENKGVAGGRNQGIANSNGVYCVFLDNDTEVSRGWDTTILNHFINNSEAWVVGHGGNYVYNYAPLVFRTANKNKPVNYVDVVAGYCFAFPKYIIDLIGNQYEGLGRFWHEDLEFCGRVRKYGKQVIEDRSIEIVHHEHKSAGENVKTHEQVKAIHGGFDERAKLTGKRLREDNTLVIFRGNKEPYSAYTIIADQLTRYLRDLGLVVLRKDDIPFDLAKVSRGFYHCNAFYMSFGGNTYGYLHQENSVSPKEWVQDMDGLDYAFSCSNFSHLAMIQGGVPTSKLISSGLTGYDDTIYHRGNNVAMRIPNTNMTIHDKYNFMTVGASQPRKGTDILIKAFAETFGKDEPVRLIIKNYGYGQHRWVLDEIAKYKDTAEIVPIYADWTSQQLAEMYTAIAVNGCYVSPHRAEGVGMTQLEAVASGCNIICSKYGGVTETLKDTMVYWINGQEVPSTFHNNLLEPYYTQEEAPLWFEPNMEELKQAMRMAYESKTAEKNIADLSEWTFKSRAEKMYDILKGYENI